MFVVDYFRTGPPPSVSRRVGTFYRSAQERSPSVRKRKNTARVLFETIIDAMTKKKNPLAPAQSTRGRGSWRRPHDEFIFTPPDGRVGDEPTMRTRYRDRPGGAPLSYFRDFAVYGHGFLTAVTACVYVGRWVGVGGVGEKDLMMQVIITKLSFRSKRRESMGIFGGKRLKHCRRRT